MLVKAIILVITQFRKEKVMLYTLRRADESSMKEVKEEMRIRQTREVFLLFSMGSQFDHLIKQALDTLGVFCLVCDPASVTAEDIKKISPKGIILSGGPVSVYEDPPPFDARIFDLGIPVLGICLGFQLWAQHIGVKVTKADKREFGPHDFVLYTGGKFWTKKAFRPLLPLITKLRKTFGRHNAHFDLFANCPPVMQVLESHGDRVESDERLTILGGTANASVAAASFKHLYGVQFHPETTETTEGSLIFSNFCSTICGAKDRYPAEKAANRKIKELRERIGDKKVLLALSGGSDSSNVAYLLKHALDGRKKQLHAVYIKGIDRPDDEKYVLKYFGNQDWLTLEIVDATSDFLAVLAGKVGMHEKRVAMRGVYKRMLEEAAMRTGASFIAQGTLYTDISESGGGYASGAKKAQIKLHHNVNLGFSIPELTPLDDCVKDTGRNIGRIIGVPEELMTRHPFPGPGQIVRIEGEVTEAKLRICRQADKIFIEELRKWDLYNSVWQAGAVVTNSITTCTKGDDAFSGPIIKLWAVWSVNGFTARWARLPHDFIDHVSRRITNEIREAGEVVYKVSCKPPTTIEQG